MQNIKSDLLINSVNDYVNSNETNIKNGGKNFSNVELYGRLLLLNFFQKNEIFTNSKIDYKIEDIKIKLKIDPKFDNFFNALLVILKKSGFIKIDNDRIIFDENAVNDLMIDDLELFKKNLIEKHNDMVNHFNLLDTCISNYDVILSAQKSPDSVMFPVYSTHLVEGIFRANMLSDYFNTLIAKISLVYSLKSKESDTNKVVKIVEVGAGTGGTSISVMDHLKDQSNVEFYFTDISKVFVKGNERKLKERYPFSIYKKLNIEEDIGGQGFTLGEFDIVIATNVVHATKNISHTLRQIYSLLTKNGVLLLNEVTKVQDFTTLTFGLLGGWWHYEDLSIRLANSPLLSIDTWKDVLNKASFCDVKVFSTSDLSEKDSFSQTLFLSQK